MGTGPHRAGDVIRRFIALRTLTAEIARWADLPTDGRPPLPEFLHAHSRGVLPVSLESVTAWLATCPAPVPHDVSARLSLAPGLTWGAAWQQLTAPVPQAA